MPLAILVVSFKKIVACGMQPAALLATSIGVMQQGASAAYTIMSTCMPLNSTLHAAQIGSMQLGEFHMPLGSFAMLVIFYENYFWLIIN